MLTKVSWTYFHHAVKRFLFLTSRMAQTKFEYVRNYERELECLPKCWIVVRINFNNFSAFSESHDFEKPNDVNAHRLMNCAATSVMEQIKEIVFAYGHNEEYSFVFKKDVNLYCRREFKLVTYVNSAFTTSYSFYWKEYFKDKKQYYLPDFDAKLLIYPDDQELKNYFSWRQAVIHTNNLYNTCFWYLVKNMNKTTEETKAFLKASTVSDKNEFLFENGINYNNEPDIFKKGTTLIRKTILNNNKLRCGIVPLNVNISISKFWKENPRILNPKSKINDNEENLKDQVRIRDGDSKFGGSLAQKYEREEECLPNCWIVVRIDGKNFSKFSDLHEFQKPNDLNALQLMNHAAISVMEQIEDIVIAYGQSDEYSFIFKKDSNLYNRKVFRLTTTVNSIFSMSYVSLWNQYFKNKNLMYLPTFDARIVLYPSDQDMRNYLSWRQADVHINNLYNTCFWNLIKKENMTPAQAQEELKGTVSYEKKDILCNRLCIDYDNEPQIFRKGTTLLKQKKSDLTNCQYSVATLDVDIIGDKFWNENVEILSEQMEKCEINGK